MKKLVSVLLAMLMVLSFSAFAACNRSAEKEERGKNANNTTDEESTGNDASKEDGNDPYAEMYAYYGVDSVPDPEFALRQYNKLLNGELKVAFCSLDFSQNMVYDMAVGMVDYFKELGQNGEIFSADGDLAVQASQIENCGTAGYDLIAVASSSVPGLADACKKVMDQGTMVIIRGALDFESCGFTPTGIETDNYPKIGWYCADMAIAYYKQTFPDAQMLKAGLGELSMVTNLVQMMQGMKDRFAAETEIKAETIYLEDEVITVDDGYNMAENALVYDPEIRAMLSFNDAPATGMNNYIMQNPQLVPSEFVVIAGGGTKESAELFEMSRSNESCFRGYVGTDYRDTSKNLRDICYVCLLGLVDTSEGYAGYPEIYCESGFGYAFGSGGMDFAG